MGDVMRRPGNAEHVPPPTRDDALVMAGILCHFVGGSTELRSRLAKWMEHHAGDLDEQIMLWYLADCHRQLEPDCDAPMDWSPYPERER